MGDIEFLLPSTSKSVVDSEEALHLIEQIQRVAFSVAKKDSALTLDTTKALLETTYKTILNDMSKSFDDFDDMYVLYDMVKQVLPFNRDDEANKILERLVGAIAHGVPKLRNKFGASSHGKDGYYLNPIEMPEAEMVVHLVDGVSGFLLKKSRMLTNPENSQRIYYSDYEEFNEDLNESYAPIDLHISDSAPIPYSKALFVYDPEAYKERLIQFLNQKEEDEQTIEIIPNQ
jgi:hypothetical protein